MPPKKGTPAGSRAKSRLRTRKGKAKAGSSTELAHFHKFPELPMELRWLIVETALDEDQKQRLGRIVLFDPHTRRISPTAKLACRLPPLLYVDRESRKILFQRAYARVEVLVLGVPNANQYGEISTWYDNNNHLQYNIDIAQQIGEVANASGLPAGYLYVNLKKDIFIVGSVPIQICETSTFERLVNPLMWHLWELPHLFITEPLPKDACARVADIRQLAWDPRTACLLCQGYHPPCCAICFFKRQGAVISRMYDRDIFTGVESFGLYLMGGENTLEQVVVDLVELDSESLLQDWTWRYYDWKIKERVLRGEGDGEDEEQDDEGDDV